MTAETIDGNATSGARATAAAKKVLLIGWDAADWKVIELLMEAGEMPNLQKLVDGGVMGNIATLQPALSPMLWTSIATGKRAYKHGIHGFSEPCPNNGAIRPLSLPPHEKTPRSRNLATEGFKLREPDSNRRPRGYEPRELPGCSIPHECYRPTPANCQVTLLTW